MYDHYMNEITEPPQHKENFGAAPAILKKSTQSENFTDKHREHRAECQSHFVF